jgi:hypothetical protein
MPETDSPLTTALTNVDRARRLLQYWEALMPYFVPQLPTFVRWCTWYDDDTLVEGITATADKASKERLTGIRMSSENLLRYCSGTCRHISEQTNNTDADVDGVGEKEQR